MNSGGRAGCEIEAGDGPGVFQIEVLGENCAFLADLISNCIRFWFFLNC